MRPRPVAAAVAAALWLVACGGGGVPVTGIAADGRDLFERTELGENAGCVTCHSRKPGVVLVGPSLAAIGVDAADRETGLTAREYLRRSIVDPDAYVVAGFDAGRMPPDWAEQLTAANIEALIEYLLTLGAEG